MFRSAFYFSLFNIACFTVIDPLAARNLDIFCLIMVVADHHMREGPISTAVCSHSASTFAVVSLCRLKREAVHSFSEFTLQSIQAPRTSLRLRGFLIGFIHI